MTQRSHSRVPLAAALLLGACNSQVVPEYEGEPLFRISGAVTLSEASQDDELVPALAFYDDRGHLDLVDVDVVGRFPSRFTLDVTAPPPASAMSEGPEGGPDYAFGYITAVAADHPARLTFASNGGTSGGCDANGCETTLEACTARGEECYRRVERCDLQGEACVIVEEEGDPALLGDPTDEFAGLSTNYVLLYLPRAIPGDNELAREFAGGQPLSAGYHLLAVRTLSEAERAEGSACFDRAQAQAVAEFNAAHGTSYSDPWGGIPCAVDPTAPATTCPPGPSEAESDEMMDAMDRIASAAGCEEGGLAYSRVADPAGAFITVEIGGSVSALTELNEDGSLADELGVGSQGGATTESGAASGG